MLFSRQPETQHSLQFFTEKYREKRKENSTILIKA